MGPDWDLAAPTMGPDWSLTALLPVPVWAPCLSQEAEISCLAAMKRCGEPGAVQGGGALSLPCSVKSKRAFARELVLAKALISSHSNETCGAGAATGRPLR